MKFHFRYLKWKGCVNSEHVAPIFESTLAFLYFSRTQVTRTRPGWGGRGITTWPLSSTPSRQTGRRSSVWRPARTSDWRQNMLSQGRGKERASLGPKYIVHISAQDWKRWISDIHFQSAGLAAGWVWGQDWLGAGQLHQDTGQMWRTTTATTARCCPGHSKAKF